MPDFFLSPALEHNLAQVFALDPLKHHVVALFDQEERVFKRFVDVVIYRVLQGGQSALLWQPLYQLQNQLASQHPYDILNEEVVGASALQVDVKQECQ